MWNELSANHISNNLANYEAARSGFFTLIVDDSLNGVVSAAYTGSDPAEAAATEKILTKKVFCQRKNDFFCAFLFIFSENISRASNK